MHGRNLQAWGRSCGTSRKEIVASHKPCYNSLRSWVMMIGFALAAAIHVQIFFLEPYKYGLEKSNKNV